MPSSLQSVTTRQVFNYVYDGQGRPLIGATVNIVLNFNQASVTSPIVSIAERQIQVVTDQNGQWVANLIPNDTITPSGTLWTIQEPQQSYDISLPSGGAQVQSLSILANTPSVLSPALTGLTGPITVTGNETVTGTLVVQGTTTLAGTTTGALVVGGTEQVQGVTRFDANVSFAGPRPFFDATHPSYGAKGDGVTNDTTAIQAALTQARLAGGGIVFLPPGTYLVTSVVHPIDNSFNACLVVGAKTLLLGAGRDATTIKMAASQSGANNFVLCNYNVLAGGDEQISFQDFSVDGNAANQSPTGLNEGVTIRRARGVRMLRVRSFNNWGTDTSTHEGADFNVNWSADISLTDCECPNTAAATSAGFSANYTTGLKYINCVSFGSGHGNGFNHAFCRQVQHVNCHSYLNANFGFNTENSDEVVYLGCVAGGQATTQQGGQNAQYPFTTNQSLGNTSHGFSILGATQGVRQELIGCISRGNTGNGLALTNSNGVRVVGGDYSNNGTYGIQWNSTTDGQTFRISGAIQASGNTSGQLRVETAAVNFAPVSQIPSPAVPASTTAFTSYFGVDAQVFITPGASTCAVSINGVATGVTLASSGVGQMFRVNGGGTITLTYTSAPTWVWMAD